MISGGGARHTRPDLLKPYLVTVSGDHAENARRNAWATVSAGLALHKDELNVVFYDRVRLIWLSKEATAIALRLIYRVRDLVPNDGSEVAEPDPPAMFLNRGMERNDGVLAAVLAPGQAHIPNHTDQAPTGNERVITALPDVV